MKAVGWFRRGVAPYLDLARFQSRHGQLITSYHPFWQAMWAVLLLVVALLVMLF